MMQVRKYGMKAWRGFSLIEVMIVVVILAVLAALAVPTFLEASLSSKLSSHANSLVASAHLARSEAIKRNAVVAICVSTDGESCAAGDWHQGWIIMCPSDDEIVCDPAGANSIVFQRQQALPAGFRITETNGYEEIRFQPTGVGVRNEDGDAVPFLMTVCRSTPSVGAQERTVTISAMGRPAVATTENGICP